MFGVASFVQGLNEVNGQEGTPWVPNARSLIDERIWQGTHTF